jgi:1-deoxy-D-xylulose-5-phosphate synthase
MSISENVGGMNRYLANFRTTEAYSNLKENVKKSISHIPVYGERMVRQIQTAKSGIKQLFVPGMLFEEMGLIYLGPVDGENIAEMKKLFLEAKRVDGPVLVHVITKKGAGYIPAERHPARFHGTEPFEIETGLPKKKRIQANYSDVFSTIMMKLADRNPKVVAITAAMPDGTGLKRFRLGYPERFFDVGIAEEHAVTFAAGMAKSGLIPVFVVYSSFLQRAYDQILHDVCLQKLPVVFAIDRAGLVGSDGETHQGIFDLSFLSTIPGMTILAPKNKWEFSDMMKYAVTLGAPVAIRYPRGLAYDGLKEFREPIEYGKSEMIYEESEVALFALGSMVPAAEKVREELKKKGHSCTLVNARFAAPFDKEMLKSLAKNHRLLVVMEENIKSGGLGEHIESFLLEEKLDISMLAVSIPDRFVEQGSVDELRRVLGIDAESVTHKILEVL